MRRILLLCLLTLLPLFLGVAAVASTPWTQPATPLRDSIASLSVGAHSVATLPSLSGWQFSLPQSALRKGTGYLGTSHRLRRALHDALHGAQLKVGFVGGSITYGDSASIIGVTDWASMVGTWATESFPNATARNGAVPATMSSYMAMCLEHSVEPDVDIIFAEYLMNDPFGLFLTRNPRLPGYEKLIRRALALPRKPAVILMQTWGHSQVTTDTENWAPYHYTNEHTYSALAQYYDLPYMSFMAATNRLHQRKAPGFGYEDYVGFNGTNHHPSDRGHKMLADLAVHLIQQTIVGLRLRPWERADTEQLLEPLPPPMLPGNEVPSSVMCLQGPSIQSVVISHEGWQFVNEGTPRKPKTGYVSSTPGSKLFLQINTTRDQPNGQVVVTVAYLRSYLHMGRALIMCESGCTCGEKEVDGHQDDRTSQTFLSAVKVTQSDQCVIAVVVLPATSSGEHKFKVSGLTISDSANSAGYESHLQDGAFYDSYSYKRRRH